VSNPWETSLLAAVFMVLTMLVVRGGVSGGIERATKILMPALFCILVVLAVRSMTLPGAMAGVEYLFRPDFSKLTVGVIMSALGQALFSLSLGMGAMITYGSYFPDDENLPQAGASVALFDTLIAILAGLIIFPALFSAGVEPGSGPGLVFIVLPTIFGNLPAGELFGIAFYFLLAIAALTSTISLLEVVVAYFVDEAGWSREQAVWGIGSICFLLAIPSALSQGAVSWLGADGPLPWDFLTMNNNIWGNYSLSLGALLICLFVGWRWGVEPARVSLEAGGFRLPAAGLWSFLIRFACPLAVAFVLGYIVLSGQYF
jgi:NSS family neurotransmitter:Na+ symporter